MGRSSGVTLALVLVAAGAGAQEGDHPPIPIQFSLPEAGFVTLVIDDMAGHRVRNLVSEAPFPAGDSTVWWDGTDDVGRIQTSINSNFEVLHAAVQPGQYQVRGLVRPQIDLRYLGTVYNPGQPPWASGDPSSEWLANHSAPSGVLWIPEEDSAASPAGEQPGGLVLVCSHVAEGGSGLAWIDLDGRKRYGQHWIGGVWTGATHLARDAGPERVPGVYAYSGSAWEAAAGGGYDGPRSELRLAELLTRDTKGGAPRDARFGSGWDRPLLAPFSPYAGLLPAGVEKLGVTGEDTRYAFPDAAHCGLSGLAVHDARLVAALPKMDQLLWVDARARRIIGTVPLADPRGLAFDVQGRLLALSGTTLLRYTVGADPLAMPEPDVLVAAGLDDPTGLAIGADGAIYVSDRGDSQQVKVFAADGALLRSIGKPGRSGLGPYDAERMRNPNGLTVDSLGRLWVAETDFVPKRVSVWTTDGQFVRAFYGPMEYGGGGTVDSGDPSRFYYNGMEFTLDPASGEYRPSAVYYQPESDTLKLPTEFRSRAPETALYHDGRRYLTDCYTVSPTNAAGSASLWLMADGVARPVAALGSANEWTVLWGERSAEFAPRLPEGTSANDRLAFAWSDVDGDGQVQPSEVDLIRGDAYGVTVMPDLSFVVSYLDGKAVRFAPASFTAAGAPRYDLAAGATLAVGTRKPQTSGGGQALATDDGWTVLTVPPEPFAAQASVAGVRNGEPMWTYPSRWPGLHPSHDAAMPEGPGELIGNTRLLGGLVTPPESDLGPVWALNGNKGNTYLFTADGLFVATLFRDCRTASWNAPKAEKGMLVNDLSQNEESFWPSIAQTPDGGIITVTGGNGGSLIRIEGLERARRLPDRVIDVTVEELRAAQEWLLAREVEQQRTREVPPLVVWRPADLPVLDGRLDEWPADRFVPVDGRAQAAVAVSGDRLVAAFRTGDAGLLRNGGESLPLLFKSGGALDVSLASVPGGLRLLVAQVGGQPRAVLYRPTDPDALGDPVTFTSPLRTLAFDTVRDVSDQVALAADGAGAFEVSVPLALLHLPAEGAQTVRGDVGLLRGNGFQTLQRAYWHNKATGITSDIPSEAELRPDLWGEWVFGD